MPVVTSPACRRRCGPPSTAARATCASRRCRCRRPAPARCSSASTPAASAAPTSRRSRRGCSRARASSATRSRARVARRAARRRASARATASCCTTTSPAGTCFYCARGALRAVRSTTSATAPRPGFEPAGGGFAEYVKALDWIVERGTIPVPDGVLAEEAAFVEPVNTCLKAVRRAGVERGPDGAGGGPGADRPAADAALPLGGRRRRSAPTRCRTGASWPAASARPRCSTPRATCRARSAALTDGRGADVRLPGRAGPAAVATRRLTPRGRRPYHGVRRHLARRDGASWTWAPCARPRRRS